MPPNVRLTQNVLDESNLCANNYVGVKYDLKLSIKNGINLKRKSLGK